MPERIKYWLRVGAQPSYTVRSFIRLQKIGKDSQHCCLVVPLFLSGRLFRFIT